MNYETYKVTDFEFLITINQKKKYYRIFWYPEQKQIRFWAKNERRSVDSLDSFIKSLPNNIWPEPKIRLCSPMEPTFEQKIELLINVLKSRNIKFERQYVRAQGFGENPISYSGKRKSEYDTLYGLTFEYGGRKMIFLASGLHYDDTDSAIEYLKSACV